jgi:hypothetical protein
MYSLRYLFAVIFVVFLVDVHKVNSIAEEGELFDVTTTPVPNQYGNVANSNVNQHAQNPYEPRMNPRNSTKRTKTTQKASQQKVSSSKSTTKHKKLKKVKDRVKNATKDVIEYGTKRIKKLKKKIKSR